MAHARSTRPSLAQYHRLLTIGYYCPPCIVLVLWALAVGSGGGYYRTHERILTDISCKVPDAVPDASLDMPTFTRSDVSQCQVRAREIRGAIRPAMIMDIWIIPWPRRRSGSMSDMGHVPLSDMTRFWLRLTSRVDWRAGSDWSCQGTSRTSAVDQYSSEVPGLDCGSTSNSRFRSSYVSPERWERGSCYQHHFTPAAGANLRRVRETIFGQDDSWTCQIELCHRQQERIRPRLCAFFRLSRPIYSRIISWPSPLSFPRLQDCPWIGSRGETVSILEGDVHIEPPFPSPIAPLTR